MVGLLVVMSYGRGSYGRYPVDAMLGFLGLQRTIKFRKRSQPNGLNVTDAWSNGWGRLKLARNTLVFTGTMFLLLLVVLAACRWLLDMLAPWLFLWAWFGCWFAGWLDLVLELLTQRFASTGLGPGHDRHEGSHCFIV